jgi:16S rRNA (uracil1498-N3)-methyltransferase
MTMNTFYCTDIKTDIAILSAEESAHCVRVLRLGQGEHVQIIDGLGNLYEAIIQVPDAKSCKLEIKSVQNVKPQRNFDLHIAIAPTKSIDRFEWFVEKAVEIGVDKIIPLLCQRSERKILKTDRLKKLVTSTMKQAGIYYCPEIQELNIFDSLVNHYSGQPNCYIGYCGSEPLPMLKDEVLADGDVIMLIGPEGDFSNAEINKATGSGFKPVSLGPNRLRTETAGIVACHTLNLLR